MNSRFIIIAILIFIKVIGVASRASADDYLPGYTCDVSKGAINKLHDLNKNFDYWDSLDDESFNKWGQKIRNNSYYSKWEQKKWNNSYYTKLRCGNSKMYPRFFKGFK